MMKQRAVSVGLFGLGAAFLFGCPIYSDRDLYDGDCWDGRCFTPSCDDDEDCSNGYYCASDLRCHSAPSTCTKPSDCVMGTCGGDNRCHAEDCSTAGCPTSYVCRLGSGGNGIPACVPIGQGGGDAGPGKTSVCRADSDCAATAGAKCLTGECVAPQDQCVDATQCTGGAQCVQGACTPKCDATKPCPTGFACDTSKGVCTTNPNACSSNAQCTGGTVCSQEHCVTPCSAEGTCSGGLVCVDGGCVPNEKPVFVCNTDGVKSDCQEGSICLRHSCYIACDADAGAEACKSADIFNECKPVTTSSGTHSVCGSTTNLGTECDPTQSKNCNAPQICIDGYCK